MRVVFDLDHVVHTMFHRAESLVAPEHREDALRLLELLLLLNCDCTMQVSNPTIYTQNFIVLTVQLTLFFLYIVYIL